MLNVQRPHVFPESVIINPINGSEVKMDFHGTLWSRVGFKSLPRVSLILFFSDLEMNGCWDQYCKTFWLYKLMALSMTFRLFKKAPLPPKWLFLGSPMVMDPYPSWQHLVWWPQQEVTRPNARFKPTSPKKSGVVGGAIRCQHISVSRFTCTHHGDLVLLLVPPIIGLSIQWMDWHTDFPVWF